MDGRRSGALFCARCRRVVRPLELFGVGSRCLVFFVSEVVEFDTFFRLSEHLVLYLLCCSIHAIFPLANLITFSRYKTRVLPDIIVDASLSFKESVTSAGIIIRVSRRRTFFVFRSSLIITAVVLPCHYFVLQSTVQYHSTAENAVENSTISRYNTQCNIFELWKYRLETDNNSSTTAQQTDSRDDLFYPPRNCFVPRDVSGTQTCWKFQNFSTSPSWPRSCRSETECVVYLMKSVNPMPSTRPLLKGSGQTSVVVLFALCFLWAPPLAPKIHDAVMIMHYALLDRGWSCVISRRCKQKTIRTCRRQIHYYDINVMLQTACDGYTQRVS